MIGTIEQAIVDRIAQATPGYTLKTVKSYGNELDGDLNTAIKSFPAVWVVFKGEGKPEQIGTDAWAHPATFSVLCGVQNRRNERATRHGGHGKPGSYQILQDVRALLAGQTMGLDMEAFQPGAVRALVNARTASIYALEVSTRYVSEAGYTRDLSGASADAVDGDFATLHVDWDVPVHGNVTGPLPASGSDVRDIIQPETGP